MHHWNLNIRTVLKSEKELAVVVPTVNAPNTKVSLALISSENGVPYAGSIVTNGIGSF